MKKGHSKVRWGDCLKYLIRGWNRKEGRGNKDLKKGTSWVKGGGGAGTPLRTVDTGILHIVFCSGY